MPPIEQNGAIVNADALARALRAAGSTRTLVVDGALDSPGSVARAIQALGGPALGGLTIDGGMNSAGALQRAIANLGVVTTSPPVVVLPQMLSVAGFGDSITYGYSLEATGQRLNPGDRWLNQVTTALNGGTPLNQGISGTVLQDSNDSTGNPQANNGRDRFVAALLGGNKQDGLFIAYGFNDARYTGAPSTFNVTQYGIQLRQVLAGCIIGGYALNKIVLVNPYYITDVGLTTGSAGFTGQTRSGFQAFDTEALAAATEYGVLFCDAYTALQTAVNANPAGAIIDNGDNIHPTIAGHLIISAAVLNKSIQPNTRIGLTPMVTATGGSGSFTFAITPVSGATSYTLQYGVDGTFAFSNSQTVGVSGTVSSVSAGALRVRASANFGDGTSTPWAFSGAITVASAAFLQQTFTGTPGTALTALTPTIGSTWAATTGFTPATPNQIDAAGTALFSPTASGVYQNAAAPASADYYVEAVISMVGVVVGDNVGVLGRASASANTNYFVRYTNTSNSWGLFQNVAGTATQIGTNQADTWTSGTRTVRLTMTGTTISFSVNGTTLVSATNAAISAAGQAGIRMGGTQASNTGMHLVSITASN